MSWFFGRGFVRRFGFPPCWVLHLTLSGLVVGTGFSADPTHRDLEYARTGEPEVSLKLDLYLPEGAESPPLVVYVHGGAWRGGSKEQMPLGGLLDHGFAIASVGYRLSPVAPFPAQAHDIKAAVRWLRRNAREFRYDEEHIAIAGTSAGGHLAALVGLSNGHEELEGRVGEPLEFSSEIAAVVSFYGPSNFLTILKQSTPHGLGVRIPALQLLLRAQPEDVPELARLASPVFHVDRDDPPLLLIHGDQDPQVPINQSHELVGAYAAAGIEERVSLRVIHGGEHGGERFFDGATLREVAEFLRTAGLE